MSKITTNRFPARHGAQWKGEEYHKLVLGIEQGLTLAQLAERHQRTPGGISSAVRRLLPPDLLQDNRSNSVNAFARYLNETKNIDRQSMINAICPYSVTGEELDQYQEAEIRASLVGQGVSSKAKVLRKINYTQEGWQRNTPITDSEFLNYEARGADVLVLVSVAVASLSKERDRVILLMRIGVEEQPLTLDEIGVKWDVSRERVRQIQERAFKRLASQAHREGTPGTVLKKLIELACSSSDAVAVWVLNIVHSDFMIPPRLVTKFILHTASFTNDNVVEIVALFPVLGGYRG
ncbi:hypothetical protein KQL11_004444 [Salmonella enterica]|nr:hypothetical protein [Salmonella enterica]EIC4370148.1 hypothetical protein [Salmonella enterica]